MLRESTPSVMSGKIGKQSSDFSGNRVKDVLVLLALCVERRGKRYGLHGNGVGIYNLSGEEGRQLTIDDIFMGAKEQRDEELKRMLLVLQSRYRLDFAGHLDQIYQMDTLHKTVEYMRKHI